MSIVLRTAECKMSLLTPLAWFLFPIKNDILGRLTNFLLLAFIRGKSASIVRMHPLVMNYFGHETFDIRSEM